MKHENNRRYSHKLWLLGALMLPLAGCGTLGSLPSHIDIGVSANDSASAITITKTVVAASPATATSPATPAKTTWTNSTAGVATFTFSSRPGSDAAYITSYRIISDVVNGQKRLLPIEETPVAKLNIYVPSGYSCPEASQTQSCDAAGSTTVPANGATSTPLSIDFATTLADTVISNNASAYRTTGIEFLGVSSRGESISIKTEVNSAGYKAGDE